jgi:hypothetical protein
MTDYEKFPGKGSYKYWDIFGRDKTDPWVLKSQICVLKCDTGYWSNYDYPPQYTFATLDP